MRVLLISSLNHGRGTNGEFATQAIDCRLNLSSLARDTGSQLQTSVVVVTATQGRDFS